MKIKLTKKWVLTFILVSLLMFISACSSESSSSDSEEGGGEETYTINIAHGNQTDEPIGQMAEKWKELAEEKSDGRLQLELYPSSQLGAERDVVEQALAGNNVIVLSGYDGLMDYVPDAGILTAPYIVEDMDEMLSLLQTDWYEELRNELSENNIEVITNTAYGVRHLMTNEAVLTPEDLDNKKVRVPDNRMSIATMESIGAAATPTPLGDMYTSLQQGLIDGAENPIPVLGGAKIHEVSKHLSLTGHQTFVIAWVGGSSFINTLPEDLVQILKETGDEASEFGKKALDKETEEVLEEFKTAGVEVHKVDTKPFKERVQEVYDSFSEWTPGLYDTIQELLKDQEK